MKKRIVIFVLVAALIIALGTAGAYAAYNGRGYVDADGDGVCDNYGSGAGCTQIGGCGGQGACYVDADGDGVCDNYGSGAGCTQSGGCGGQGACYVDADGDGVCDNCGSGAGCAQSGGCGGRPQDGTGMKWGHCGGRGHR